MSWVPGPVPRPDLNTRQKGLHGPILSCPFLSWANGSQSGTVLVLNANNQLLEKPRQLYFLRPASVPRVRTAFPVALYLLLIVTVQ